LGITDVPGLGSRKAYELVSANATEVVYRTVLEGRLEVVRRYRLGASGEEADPYTIRHETTVRDISGNGAPQTFVSLSLGTSELTSATGWGQQYLGVMTWDGEEDEMVNPRQLEGGGFLAMIGLRDGAPKSSIAVDRSVVWSAVTNQFFTSIYTGDQTGLG